MVNVSEMTPDLAKELAFSEEELKGLEKARNKEIAFDEDVLDIGSINCPKCDELLEFEFDCDCDCDDCDDCE